VVLTIEEKTVVVGENVVCVVSEVDVVTGSARGAQLRVLGARRQRVRQAAHRARQSSPQWWTLSSSSSSA
jgi:hypothetical protein